MVTIMLNGRIITTKTKMIIRIIKITMMMMMMMMMIAKAINFSMVPTVTGRGSELLQQSAQLLHVLHKVDMRLNRIRGHIV